MSFDACSCQCLFIVIDSDPECCTLLHTCPSHSRRPAWNVLPLSRAPFPVESTAVGPLHTQRRLLAMDDGEVIAMMQRTQPWSKALTVRHTEVAPASLRKSENAITSPRVLGKEAERRCVYLMQKMYKYL